jgi:hypothetical protein
MPVSECTRLQPEDTKPTCSSMQFECNLSPRLSFQLSEFSLGARRGATANCNNFQNSKLNLKMLAIADWLTQRLQVQVSPAIADLLLGHWQFFRVEGKFPIPQETIIPRTRTLSNSAIHIKLVTLPGIMEVPKYCAGNLY